MKLIANMFVPQTRVPNGFVDMYVNHLVLLTNSVVQSMSPIYSDGLIRILYRLKQKADLCPCLLKPFTLRQTSTRVTGTPCSINGPSKLCFEDW